jgi:hypothetical protein
MITISFQSRNQAAAALGNVVLAPYVRHYSATDDAGLGAPMERT